MPKLINWIQTLLDKPMEDYQVYHELSIKLTLQPGKASNRSDTWRCQISYLQKHLPLTEADHRI